ncbi:TolC family protein [Leptospirillum ferriphilum]|uniref:Outer membrane efflux protein n=2 Tax=Leptospirillum TaxID=179 RepID=A0A094WDW4_9BACT|nr:TolC family protein [Leptospirillum ferriphilum]EDZ40074.1 MAG: Putative outer membrane efflux protein [Leptospirillum sp. Group II '5-way CG']KGA94705.1 outer membrane efflux protein [Leptospirillum ferriphilum]
MNLHRILFLITLIVLECSGFSWAADPASQKNLDRPPKVLGLNDAIFFGLTHHPKIFMFRHQVQKAKAAVQIANAHFLPNVGAGAMFGAGEPGVGNRVFNNAYAYSGFLPVTYGVLGPYGHNANLSMAQTAMASLGVTQLLYDFGKYEHLTRSRKELTKASVDNLLTRDAWVILQVKEAYYHVILDRKLIEVYQKNLEQRQMVRDLTRSLYRANYKSRLDYDLAVVDLEKAKALLVNEQNDLESQIARLNEAMGLGKKSRKNYRLKDKAPENFVPVPLEELISTGVQKRPELLSTTHRYHAGVEKTASEKAKHYPYISAFGNYGYLGNMVTGQSYSPGLWTGGAMINVPIYTGGMIRGMVARAREATLTSQYHEQDWRIRIRLQVTQAYDRVRADAADIVAYTKAVKEAKLALLLANKKYEANLISIVQLTLAEVYLLDAEASLALAEYHMGVDQAALRFTTGIDYPEYVTMTGQVRDSQVKTSLDSRIPQ